MCRWSEPAPPCAPAPPLPTTVLQGWVDKSSHKYMCPADKHLHVSFHLTPEVRCLPMARAVLPHPAGPAPSSRRPSGMLPALALHTRARRRTPATPRCAQEFSLHGVWEALPSFLFYAFGISFLGVSLAIGIFRPRKQMPVDMFQVGCRAAALPVLASPVHRLGSRLAGQQTAPRLNPRAGSFQRVHAQPTSMLPLLSSPPHPALPPTAHPHPQAMEFAQSKGNARRDGSTGVTFADVGGLGNTIGEMMQVVEVRGALRRLSAMHPSLRLGHARALPMHAWPAGAWALQASSHSGAARPSGSACAPGLLCRHPCFCVRPPPAGCCCLAWPPPTRFRAPTGSLPPAPGPRLAVP